MTEDNNKHDTPTDGLAADAASTANEAAEAVEEAAEAVIAGSDGELKDILPGADDEHSVVGAAVNLFGISRPQDEYGTRSTDRDGMTDEELLEMGVEPDAGPSNTLMWTFLGLTCLLLVIGYGLASMFNVAALQESHRKSAAMHPVLGATITASAEVMGSYGEVTHPVAEGEQQGPTGYRVPVDVGMNMLLSNPDLLRMHPLGESQQLAEPVVPVAPSAVPVEGAAADALAPEGEAAALPTVEAINPPADANPGADQ